MKLLLDTHAFLWWDSDPNRLSPQALSLCQDLANVNPSIDRDQEQSTARRPELSPPTGDQGTITGGAAGPAQPQRVGTWIAEASQTRWPCSLTRTSSACACPNSRGGTTRCRSTRSHGAPVRAGQATSVRSSTPNAATIACTGQPYARSVTTTSTTRSTARRR